MTWWTSVTKKIGPLTLVWQLIFIILVVLLGFLGLPIPGIAILFLTIAAVVMTVEPPATRTEKVVWLLIVVAFSIIEYRAIRKDRNDQELQQATTRKEERDSFAKLLSQNQENFEETIRNSEQAQAEGRREFDTMLNRQAELFGQQRQFTDFLTGKLIPANDPMPDHRCGALRAGEVVLFMGTNTYIPAKFPHTVLMVNGKSLVSIDKTSDGAIQLSVDSKDKDQTIIFRLDNTGFRSATGGAILRPDKSTVIFEDRYGEQKVMARYVNERAFRLEGVVSYGGKDFPLFSPSGVIQNSCFLRSNVDITVR